MSWAEGAVRRRSSTRLIVGGAVGAFILIAALGASGAAAVWQDGLADQGRVLPGASVAGVDLDGRTVEEARAEVEAAAARLLARPVALIHGEQRWETTAAELGGAADVEDALTEAITATRNAGLHRAVAARWFGARTGTAVSLAITLDEAAVDELLDEAIAAVERPARDATIAIEQGSAVVVPARVGYTVDRMRSREALQAALQGGEDATAAIAASELPFDVATAEVESLLAEIGTAVEELLVRPVTLTHGDREWIITARDLGGTLDLEPVIAAHVAAGRSAAADADEPVATSVRSGTDLPPLAVELGDGVEAFVDGLAEEIDAPVADAVLDHSTGWVELTPEQRGRRLDRRAAARLLTDALTEGGDRIELPVQVTEPDVTVADFEHVLLVRLDQRRLYLYEDGVIVRDWPVATGAAGYNTPAGTFAVGLKRPAPTWHNPAPNGWGADMPDVIGPGPNNPLGLRALNWVREDGAETLIRFHGTSNTRSIGTAASKGCIRLTNADIVELYDLVPTGATIISTWG